MWCVGNGVGGRWWCQGGWLCERGCGDDSCQVPNNIHVTSEHDVSSHVFWPCHLYSMDINTFYIILKHDQICRPMAKMKSRGMMIPRDTPKTTAGDACAGVEGT